MRAMLRDARFPTEPLPMPIFASLALSFTGLTLGAALAGAACLARAALLRGNH